MSEEELTRGQPRVQYARTYVLLPPQANAFWAAAVVNTTWDKYRWTFGGSADDAGVGDLDVRRIIAINLGWWTEGGAGEMLDWFLVHYPDVEIVQVNAACPALLEKELAKL